MPILNPQELDILIWKASTSGSYTVRSAYHILMETMIKNQVQKVPGQQNTIWDLQSPPKIKHFLWRTLGECLPTRMRLRTKVVTCSSLGAYFENNFENEWHVFFCCDQVKSVWTEVGIWHTISSHIQSFESAQEMIFNMLHTLPTHQKSIFATTLWCIWKRRNDKIWEAKNPTPKVSSLYKSRIA